MCAINYASNVAHRRRERFPRAATQPAAAHYRERDSAFVGCRSARRCDGARAGGTAGDRIFACIHVTSDHHHHWSPLVTTTATIFTSYHKLATTIITTGTTTIRARSPRTTGAAAARSTTTNIYNNLSWIEHQNRPHNRTEALPAFGSVHEFGLARRRSDRSHGESSHGRTRASLGRPHTSRRSPSYEKLWVQIVWVFRTSIRGCTRQRRDFYEHAESTCLFVC
jgi:hypothetical protein